MKRIFFLCGLLLLALGGLKAQINDNSILLIVGTDTTTRGDFYKTYTQNAIPGRITTPDRHELENYLQLYINFRLKVEAAKAAGYDTMPLLQQELATYRAQFAKPYLTDTKLEEALLREAYEHMQYDIYTRHILIPVSKYPYPSDTQAAYKKCMDIRKQILSGVDFCDMVIRHSSDYRNPNGKGPAIKTGREGELGYITGLSMVYPFEKALYNLRVGEISMPVKTRYGYHLIQMLDKRPALGKVRASHIMISDTTEYARKRIDSIYERLQGGEDFADLARQYSDDKFTASKGGDIGTFTSNRMVPELIVQLYDLPEGQFSKPFRTRFGWHIVKLMEKSGIDTYENMRNSIVYSFDNDNERGPIAVKAFQQQLLAQSKWKIDKKVLADIRKALPDTVDGIKLPRDSMENPKLFSKTLLVYEGENVSVWAFFDLARKTTKRDIAVNVNLWLDEMVNNLLGSQALVHEFSILEQKYPEFAAMMKEYRDGIYLFDINNRKVWGKAVSDTAGLENYYNTYKNKYKLPGMAVATLAVYNVSETETKQVGKFMEKAYKGKWSVEKMRTLADAQFGKGKIQIDSASFTKGKNQFMDNVPWEKGLTKNILSGTHRKAYAIIHNILPPVQGSFEEMRGKVISDYQGYLETEWLKELHNTYKVTINQDVFESLLQKK